MGVDSYLVKRLLSNVGGVPSAWHLNSHIDRVLRMKLLFKGSRPGLVREALEGSA